MLRHTEFDRYQHITIDSSVISAPLNVRPVDVNPLVSSVVPIVDSKKRNPSLNSLLYEKSFTSLEVITPEALKSMMDDCVEVESLLEKPRVVILQEVLQETVRVQELMDQHDAFFSESARQLEGTKFQMTPYQTECLKRLGNIRFRFSQLVRKAQKKTVNLDWNSPANAGLLEIANIHSKDLDREYIQSISHWKRPSYLGQTLRTDQKLVVASFVYAREGDTLLLTRDNGIHILVQRFGKQFQRDTSRKGYIVSSNPLNGYYQRVEPPKARHGRN